MAVIRLKGGKGSGNFGHAGRPGQVGGSVVDGDAALTSDQRLAWDQNVNIATYARLQQPDIRGYADHVNKRIQNIVWGDVSREDFIASINEPGPDIPKASAQDKMSVGYLLHALKGYAAEHPAANLIGWNELQPLLKMSEAEFDYMIYSRGGSQYFQWERRFGLNQLRLHTSDYALSPKTGIVSTQQAVRTAIKAMGYSNPGKFYDYIKSLYNNGEVKKERGAIRLKGGEGSGNFDHAGRPGKVGGSAPSSAIVTQLAEDDPYIEDLHQYLLANERKYAKFYGGDSYSASYFHLGQRVFRGQGNLTRDYAMAQYIESKTDRETMLFVMGSQENWTMSPGSAYNEWAAINTLTTNKNKPKGLIDVQLTDRQIAGFKARQEYNQALFRELYGEEVVMYRGVNGRYAGKLRTAMLEKAGITIEDADKHVTAKVYGLSSFSNNRGRAYLFASNKSRRLTGLVLSRTVKAEDVWILPRDAGVAPPITFSDDIGEVVTLNTDDTMDFYIEDWDYGN
jgi:hypothetical protein